MKLTTLSKLRISLLVMLDMTDFVKKQVKFMLILPLSISITNLFLSMCEVYSEKKTKGKKGLVFNSMFTIDG